MKITAPRIVPTTYTNTVSETVTNYGNKLKNCDGNLLIDFVSRYIFISH